MTSKDPATAGNAEAAEFCSFPNEIGARTTPVVPFVGLGPVNSRGWTEPVFPIGGCRVIREGWNL